MSSKVDQNLERVIKKASIINYALTFFGAISTALIVSSGFYYNTTNTQTTQSSDIDALKTEVVHLKEKAGTTEVTQGVSSQEIKDIKEWMIRMEQKQDKILEKVSGK